MCNTLFAAFTARTTRVFRIFCSLFAQSDYSKIVSNRSPLDFAKQMSNLSAFTRFLAKNRSNPDCSPGFRPSPSELFWLGAFATGGPTRIIAFYCSPYNTPNSSQSQVLQFSLHAVRLSPTISQEIYRTGYERFRPNKYDPHLWRRCYRGGWHRSCPPLILQDPYSWQKPIQSMST
jgi:hypothetical protein